MSRLGCDVVLGDIQAQNISCKSITVDDASNPTIPTEITVDTITATESITSPTGNFDLINVATLNVSNPDDPTIPSNLTVNSITAESGNISNLQSDKTTCTVFHCPQEYNSNNITDPKCNNGVTIGTKDGNGYNYEDVNLQINSWYSSGFVDTDSKTCNLTINHRNGNLQTKGNISGNTGNFDVINVATLNVSNPDDPDDPTIPTDLNVSSITATTGNIENLTTDTITS
jgi:hypothetical protein